MRIGLFILLVMTFASLAVYVFYNDKESEPKIQTIQGQAVPICDEGLKLQYSRDNSSHLVCYNPSPFGHTIITSPQLIAFVLTIAIIGMYTLHGWRDFLSSKILPYENKYQDEVFPISKAHDTFEQRGYIWTRNGYDALIGAKGNDFYVARKNMVELVQKNVILKGALQRVTPECLFLYVNRDISLFREILGDRNIEVTARGRISNISTNIRIFIPVPLDYQKSRAFSTIHGGYDFNADRFRIVMTNLFKMRQGLDISYRNLTESNKRMLEDATKVAEKTAVISDAYGKTQEAKIVDREAYVPPEARQGYDSRGPR